MKYFPKDLDIYFPYDLPKRNLEQTNLKKALLNKNSCEKGNMDPYFLGYKWGNSIYFLSKKGAEKLLTINPIKDRLDNEFVNLSLNGRLNAYYEDVPWLTFEQIDWGEWPARIKCIWDTLIKISPWTMDRKRKVKKLLSIISDIAYQLKIELVLQGGTHLGYIQHGGIMPWDDDVDLGIEEKDVSAFFEKLQQEQDVSFDEFVEHRSQKNYYKIWGCEGEEISGYKYTFPFIDLWVYKRQGADLVFANGIICPNSALYEFKKIIFEDSLFYIRANSIEVLDSRYTSWKDKIIVYAWGHRLEQPYFPRVSLPIQTDDEGRMIGLKNNYI